jgi:hypothetical protein
MFLFGQECAASPKSHEMPSMCPLGYMGNQFFILREKGENNIIFEFVILHTLSQ